MNKKNLYSPSEFNAKSLPKNRKEVFFDVFKLHFFSFVKMGVILLLFALPLLGAHFYKDYSYITMNETGDSNMVPIIVCSSIEFVGIFILSIPIAGFGKIYHEYAWLEPVFFADDFKEGIKENIKPTLISAFIIGLLNSSFDIAYALSPTGWLIAIPFGLSIVVFYPILLHVIYMNFIYTNPYGKNFKLGCFFYLRHIPTTFLCLLVIMLPKIYAFFHFANVIAILTKYLVILVYIIFVLPFAFLGVQLNEMRLFDKHINLERFPDLVDRGLHKDDENEDE